MINSIFPGSFDPITLGHMDIIKRASLIFDKLIIGISFNTSIDNSLFSKHERLYMVTQELRDYNLCNVKVKIFTTLLIDFIKSENIYTIVRGVRNTQDLEYEFQMFGINQNMLKHMDMVLLPSIPSTKHISSTLVKEIARLGGDLHGLVSSQVGDKLKKIYNI